MITYEHLNALLELLAPVPPSTSREALCELAVYLERMLLAALHEAFDERMQTLANGNPTPSAASQPSISFSPGGASDTSFTTTPEDAGTMMNDLLDVILPGSEGITRRAMGNAEILVTYAANLAAQSDEPYLRQLTEDELDQALNAVDEAFSVVEARAAAVADGERPDADAAAGTSGPVLPLRLSMADEIALCAVFAEARAHLVSKGYPEDSPVVMNTIALQDRVLGGAA